MFATAKARTRSAAIRRWCLALVPAIAWCVAGGPWARSQPPADAAGSTKAAGQSQRAADSGSDVSPADLSFADANGDGAISRSEWARFLQSFTRLDTDKNAALDAAELKAAGGADQLLLTLADANGDGQLIRAEWTRLAKGFSRMDTNRDGSLNAEELGAAAQALAAAASGSASLAGGSGKGEAGPTLWRGRIQGDSQVELLVAGNRIVGREIGPEGGRSLGAGTYVMTGNGQMGNMDAMYTDGPHAGQFCPGIYRLEKETLYWCVNNVGIRPSELRTGQGNWLLILKRVDTAPPAQSTK